MKHNQFYREVRLTCPLYRSTEDICKGICVFKRVLNVWHILKKSVSMLQHFEQFVGKKRRVELKSVGNFVANTVLIESANQFSLEELCRTQNSLKYSIRSHVDHQTYGKTLKARLSFNSLHTVKSTGRRMNTPVLIAFSTWVHTIFSCLWTVLLFLTWLYTRFWLYMMQKHPYFEKHSISLQIRSVIRFATIYDRIIYKSRISILSSTLNRIESRRFISVKISAEIDIYMTKWHLIP